MISLLLASGTSVTGEYSASVDPGRFSDQVSNGNYTTPFFEVSVQNGTGPFEYQWTASESAGYQVNINNPTSKRTNLNIGSSNNEVIFDLICTVKDTGNEDAETTGKAKVFITFGENLQ